VGRFDAGNRADNSAWPLNPVALLFGLLAIRDAAISIEREPGRRRHR
jgi:hypothetical protein